MTKDECDDMCYLFMNFTKNNTKVNDLSIVNAITEYKQLIVEITNIIKYDLPINYVDYNNRDTMISDIKSKYSIFDIAEIKKYLDTLKQLLV
jgi:hypothetical protein